MNSLRFCVSEKVLVLCSFLKAIFSGYRIPRTVLFFQCFEDVVPQPFGSHYSEREVRCHAYLFSSVRKCLRSLLRVSLIVPWMQQPPNRSPCPQPRPRVIPYPHCFRRRSLSSWNPSMLSLRDWKALQICLLLTSSAVSLPLTLV